MKDTKKDHKRTKEIAGVILVALSLFLILCLVSYKSTDPSFTHYAPGKVIIQNLGGFVGAYSSDSLLRVLGISAYWIPIVFIILSFQLLLNRHFRITPISVVGFIGLVFSTATLLAGRYKTIALFGVTLNAGGLLGTLSSDFLQSYLNHIGTYLLLVVILIVSLMITLDVSMVSLTRQFLVLLGRTAGKMKTFLLIRIERLKRKKKLPYEKKVRGKRDVPIIHD
ncbi:MAG: DNA translocase FtsK 4TM domain-containing protein, partial [Deltaproteobacteria bacterium]|nr:DNA translocase FtsK 4TM domain-containing protein [Deltaproteobacteria bacterium]